jgi:hypothetical protein
MIRAQPLAELVQIATRGALPRTVVAGKLLRAACCVLRAACCVLRAACCVLRAACCVLRAETQHCYVLCAAGRAIVCGSQLLLHGCRAWAGMWWALEHGTGPVMRRLAVCLRPPAHLPATVRPAGHGLPLVAALQARVR